MVSVSTSTQFRTKSAIAPVYISNSYPLLSPQKQQQQQQNTHTHQKKQTTPFCGKEKLNKKETKKQLRTRNGNGENDVSDNDNNDEDRRQLKPASWIDKPISDMFVDIDRWIER